MNHKSSASSSSVTPPQYPVRSVSSSSNAHSTPTPNTPAVIPLDYDYQTMSPSSLSLLRPHPSNTVAGTAHTYRTHNRIHTQSGSGHSRAPLRSSTSPEVDVELDNQYSSLFGDPVPPPPPPDFLSTQFEAAHLFRGASLDVSSGEEEPFGRTVTLDGGPMAPTRLFSNVPFNSTFTSRRLSDGATQRQFDVLQTSVPRLRPPDIQILPNSSGGSSSEPQDSPNYALLSPEDILRRPTIYDISDEPADVTELLETMTISDATGRREYSEATRRVSSFTEDFKSNVGSLSNTQTTPQATSEYARQFSNESYSSSEWFRPASHDYPEFSKIPRLRPSSKNVMSIKRDEMPMHQSPVAAMINDSNGSSSGEERVLNTTQVLEHPTVSLDALTPPARPPDPSPSRLREIEHDLLFSPQPTQYPQQRLNSSIDSLGPTFPIPLPPAAPPPELPTPIQEETEASEETKSIKREMSPVIITDSVATGSDYRVEQPRLHKKTAFTIITAKSPQSSCTQSPSSYAAPQRTPSKTSLLSDTSTKPIAKPRYHLKHKSLSSIQLRLPQLPQLHQIPPNDSPRPSVQFNMGGRRSPDKMPQRGILHHRESLTSSQDTPLPSTTATPTPMRRHSTLPPSADLTDGHKMRSCEMLPLITDPYRTAIPRLHRSALDIRRESAVIPPGALPRPLKPNPNPTRKQKGLLRIVNGTDMSHIPLRSNWASMDDLSLENRRKPFLGSTYNALQKRRRSSSTSPERRSSTLTASDRRSSNLSTVTTSDFSFRRPSVTPPLSQRRKSILPALAPTAKRRPSLSAPNNLQLTSGRTSRTKIAKPTTLSPIIGTPNKDSSAPSSPAREALASLAACETHSDNAARRDSLSKIPVRSSSRGNSRSNSRLSSRSNSPLKDFTAQLPLSGLTSRATSSRTPSRATARSESQAASGANSRTPSRSTSRASTRPISRAASRPNSRMEQAKELANSRSNSRLSTHSMAATPRADSVSPSAGRTIDASSPTKSRKSISLSPQPNRRPLARRQSLSPPAKGRQPSRGRGKAQREQSDSRHSSNSRIPLRATSSSRAARSPAGRNVAAAGRAQTRSPTKAKTAAKARKPSPMASGANQRKKSPSAKKAPTSVRKPESSVKRTPSSVGKQAAAVKKQPSNLQKTGGSNLRREASNVQKKAAGVGAAKAIKREASSMSVKKSGTSGSMAATGDNKRPTATKGAAAAAKTAEAKGAAKATETGGGAKKNGVGAVSSATGVIDTAKAAAATAAVATAVAAGSGTGTSGSGSSASGMRRHPSNTSLVRMASRMSLLSLKRSDSNLSKKTLVPAVAEETLPDAETKGQPAPLRKVNSRGQLMTSEEVAALPATILEKSQKTLENVQKTVTEATDEIHKTIHENLSDLKNLESDVGRMSDSAGSPTSSVATVVENRGGKGVNGESVSRAGTAEGAAAPTAKSQATAGTAQKSPVPPTQPIEADVSVLNAAGQAQVAATGSGMATAGGADAAAAAAERNYEYDIADKAADGALNAAVAGETAQDALAMRGDGRTNGADDEIKRRSPDGQGGSTAGSGNGSREFLKEQDEDSAPASGCCRCCTRFCMPCRRSRCSRCCRRKQSRTGGDEAEEPVLSATSSATTTNLEVIDETATRDAKPTKKSCWRRLNCCKRCRKKPTVSADPSMTAEHQTTTTATAAATAPASAAQGPTLPKQGKCGRCWSRLFCCRSVNKVDPTTGDQTQVKKCCFCIPCRRKRDMGRGSTVGSVASAPGSVAWQDPERGITATDASVLEGTADALPKQGCCKRFWSRMLCCRKKPMPRPSDSRRASMKAPPPPAEDTRRKLHVDLVEYNSKMKGAIPVLPLYLAWFCAICNTLVPGLGTLLSGFFCICLGIPRFSQYDSAKARLGSFIINIIVAVAQLFCVLFCFVGWGWSIWWGTIMLKCARKLNKIKKVERLEMEEEKRQAEAAAAAATAARVVAVTTTVTETAKT